MYVTNYIFYYYHIIGTMNVVNNISKLGIKYEKTILAKGEIFTVKKLWHPKIDHWNAIYHNIKKPFNINKFVTPSFPICIGKTKLDLIQKCPNVLRVPIKKGGSDEIRIPKELLCMSDEILRILNYDYFIMGAMWKNMFCHLTIHNAFVEAGTTQRFSGFHGDGLQGAKFSKKILCEHSYVMTAPYPTIISMQPYFVAHYNDCRDNIFKAFDQQVKQDSLYRLQEENIYLIDPYVVHASPVLDRSTYRTFFRLTTTPKELLMPKNTINPMFDGQMYPDRIEVREFVTEPSNVIPYNFYGIQEI